MTGTEWLDCTDPQQMLRHLTGDGTYIGSPSDRKLRLFACACCRQICDKLPTKSKEAVEMAEKYADGQVTLGQLTPWAALAEVMQMRRWEEARVPDISEVRLREDAEWSALCWVGIATSKDMITGGTNGTGFVSNEPILNTTVPSAIQAALFRDIFGNPFRPVTFGQCRECGGTAIIRVPGGHGDYDNVCCQRCNPDPLGSGHGKEKPSWLAWNDHIIIRMAQSIYDDCAFDRLPILADALEEAGCTNEEILQHCRGWERIWQHCGQRGHYTDCGEWKTIPTDTPHVRGCWVIDMLLGKE